MFATEPVIMDMVCDVRVAEETITAPCRVIVATNEDVTGISFRIERQGVVLDNRFFGVYDSQGLQVTHFGSDTQSPIELRRPGRCAVKAEKIRCTIFIGNNGVISVSAH